jgi:hypothetical protein
MLVTLVWRRRGRRGLCQGLHSSLRLAVWSPSVSPMEPLSTSAGGPTPSSLPATSCSTSSSAACWGRFPCFNYGWTGHFARECIQPRQGYSPRAPSPPSSQYMAMIHAPSSRVGRANFTTAKEIPPTEEVLTGTFYLFEHPIIILFDSGASHEFMSLTCAQKAKLTL